MVGTQMNQSDSALGAPLAATLDLDPPVIVVVALTPGAKAGHLLLTSDRGRVSIVAVQVSLREHVLETNHIPMSDYFTIPVVRLRSIRPLDPPEVIVIGPFETGDLLLT